MEAEKKVPQAGLLFHLQEIGPELDLQVAHMDGHMRGSEKRSQRGEQNSS